ncbi:MAG TPA: multicopper oxidase domain-containing protein [Gaiellaceae bacterium]|nr:multicopper oxidase domain-containing protein [Gaiellaceae bacterium]
MRALLVLAVSAAAVVVAASPLFGARTPSRVQVTALEFEYRLSRLSVRQGPALIELVNYGEDEHDLVLRRVGGTRTYRLRKILPGQRATLALRLRPGVYRLHCAVADHAGRGMRATLRVRR